VERNTLGLVEAVSTYSSSEGRNAVIREGHFLDFVVDGAPLRNRLPGSDDLATNLNASWQSGAVVTALLELRGLAESESPPAHVVPLLVCRVCGDLGCGAWLARIDVDEDVVRWTGFRWTDWSEGTDADSGTRPATDLDVLTFDRHEYEAALADAAERVRALPRSAVGQSGGRRKWPWAWGWKLPQRPDGSRH
jgi:hypothetical protein